MRRAKAFKDMEIVLSTVINNKNARAIFSYEIKL